MSVQATSSRTPARVSFRSLAVAGGTVILTAVAANLITLVVLKAVFNLPEGFPPLTPGPIIFFTTIGMLLATVAYAIVARFSTNPAFTFGIVAVIALVISGIPNMMLMMNPQAAPFPGGTSAAFGTLLVFHVIAASVAILVLPRRVR